MANHDTETQKLNFSEQYSLERLDIVSSGNVTNIKPLMVEMSYYEDIFRNAVTGHVTVNDTNNIIEGLGLCGNEFLAVSFRKSKDSQTEIKKYFKIYRVSERKVNDHFMETYSLHFCSDELLISEQLKISKPYTGMLVSDMVEKILTEEMKVKSQRVGIYPTEGLHDIIIPYKNPFEAINWLCNYARPKSETFKKIGADYLFFENIYGFNFVPLQTLFNTKSYSEYSFIPRNISPGSGKPSEDADVGVKSIKSYKFLDTFDTLYGTNQGVFANRLMTIDPLLRTYRVTDFDYLEYQNTTKNLGKSAVINDYKDRFGKQLNEKYESVFKVMTSNAGQKDAKYIKDNDGRIGSVANDAEIENCIPNRTAQIALSNYTRLSVSLAGDPNLTVGNIITLNIPTAFRNETRKLAQKDEFLSGDYLITSVRHIMDANMRYDTLVEVVLNGRNKELYSVKMTNEFKRAVDGEDVLTRK